MKMLKPSELEIGEVYLIKRAISGPFELKAWQPAIFEGIIKEANKIDQLKFKFLMDDKYVTRWSSDEIYELTLAWLQKEIEDREAKISELQDHTLKLYRLKVTL